MESITYRKVKQTDTNAIVSIDESRYGTEKAISFFYVKECCVMHHETFIVAEIGGKIVGFCIGISSKVHEAGWISAITILKEYGGRKIGKSLLNIVCEKLKTVGCTSVSLTAEFNLLEYYVKVGFKKKTSKLKNYYGKNEHRFVLEKILS